MTRAVLFDLDDTIFDHKHSRLCGLVAIQGYSPELRGVSLKRLEEEHEALLQSGYGSVLDGSISLEEGRLLRTRGLFQGHGILLDDAEARKASAIYRAAYEGATRPVPGVVELLELLSREATLGVVTNGLERPQKDKLRACEVERFFDAVIVSESVGERKPEHAIFRLAMGALDAVPERTSMVGDSWKNDIVPSHELGINAIWLNRHGMSCPNVTIAKEIHGFEEASPGLFHL
jgi:putative hydrolase of the HAD superfamily